MSDFNRRDFFSLTAAGALAAVVAAQTGADEMPTAEKMTADQKKETETSFALTRPAYVSQSHLVVSDLAALSAFYQRVIGLKLLEKGMSGEVLGAGGRPLLTLTTRGDAVRAPRAAAGLFHTAFLLPNRAELARWLTHAVRNDVVLEGASDHLVSEAIYLSDPEGNGIEVYADRSPDAWTMHADGTVEMATRRLDLQALYDSAPKDPWDGMADGAAIGHIHLQVGDIPKADAFYRDVLGLKIMATYPGASFFASGGYHHHVAANIWNSRGAQARADNMTGLSDYTLRFNDRAMLNATVARLDELNIKTTRDGDVWSLKDPWGIGLKLVA